MESGFDINVLRNIVRIGSVSAVDVENHTARVVFADKNGMPSGMLKVLRTWPNIQIEKWDDGAPWTCVAKYATEDRQLTGAGTTFIYTKDDHDEIGLKKDITYKGETHSHEHKTTVRRWLPFVGEMVLCLYLPNGESDGFILGGID